MAYPYVLASVVGLAILIAFRVSQLPSDETKAKSGHCVPYEDIGQVWIRAGTFTLGEFGLYGDEGPAREITVEGFWIDTHEVTNAQFSEFVDATNYVTVAERKPNPNDYPGVPAELLVPGSALFIPPTDVSNGGDITQWWQFVPGASWRHPYGPDSAIDDRKDHPVIHIAHEDALAYAAWKGRDLPSEAEWEFAARGGAATRYPWGDELSPGQTHMANTWQGSFPLWDAVEDGHSGLSPVGCFSANGYGLYDMIGNVWEWTNTPYFPAHNIPIDTNEQGFDPRQPGLPVRVIKGGSFLCAPNYCLRYRPAARHAQDTGLGTGHIGFRTVLRDRQAPKAET